MNKRQIFFGSLAILMMLLIFLFSSNEGDDSENMSYAVGRLLCSFFVSDFDELTEERQNDIAGKIDYPIRKTAHMFEYALLSLFLAGAMIKDFKVLKIKKFLPVIAVGIVYAASDEIHQLFVPGRSGRVFDVFVDTLGMILALLALRLVCHIRSGKKSIRIRFSKIKNRALK